MYPPHSLGGYELTWRSAVTHLRSLGYEVRVLTTDFRLPRPRSNAGDEHGIQRELRWYWRDHRFPRVSVRERVDIERHNAEVLERVLDELRPDAVSWWAMGGMSLSLIERVRRAGIPAASVVGDDWMIYGPKVDAWLRPLLSRRRLAALAEHATGLPATLDLGRAGSWLFNSQATRRRAEARWCLPDADVAHPGVDHELLRASPAGEWRGRLLYIGRIDRRKGIDLAVEALALLPAGTTLDVIGGGDPEYRAQLAQLCERRALERRVSFGQVERDQVQDVYASADAVLFPVLWQEPWGLVPLEAMAVGRPVIASGRGGSGEYLRDGENCLIADPDRGPADLAAAVERLARDEELRSRLRSGGIETAARFTESAYNEAIAAAIERAGAPVASARAEPARS
jgi:glycosyltransferase involved in cell wall biosynthesis